MLTGSLDCGSLPNRSLDSADTFPDSWRSSETVAGVGLPSFAVNELIASTADTPIGLRVGSGMPSFMLLCTVGPPASSRVQSSRAVGQPRVCAAGLVSASTTGELATEMPRSGTLVTPSLRTRASQKVESGSQTSGWLSPLLSSATATRAGSVALTRTA
jgi:hypothetical protein